MDMGVLMLNEHTHKSVFGSRLWVIHFYQEQLEKFKKIGIGNKDEFNVTVTQDLIDITQARLDQLSTIFPITKKERDKLKNGSTNNNGTVKKSRSKSNSDSGHGRSKS